MTEQQCKAIEILNGIKNEQKSDGEQLISNDDYFFLLSFIIDSSRWLKSADGEDLPAIDREVIALTTDGKVVFAHRPKESWKGKNINTGEVTTYYPKRYGVGQWNAPDIKWWLDIQIPIIER